MREKNLQGVLNSSLSLPLTDSPIPPFPAKLLPMRTLPTILCLTFAVLLFGAGEGFALPPCPEEQWQRWTNCFGTITYANGDKYVGEFRDDKYNGQGTYTYANGDKYVGGYRDGKKNGQGTFTFADGSKYLGEFRDGLPNGQGTFTFADGRVKEGIWENGELKQ